MHKGVVGWQQFESTTLTTEGSTSTIVGVRKPQVHNNSTTTFNNNNILQLLLLASIPPTLPCPTHLPHHLVLLQLLSKGE